MLREIIISDFNEARKIKDETSKVIFGLLKDAIEKKEKNENGNEPLNDIQITQVVTKVLKETKESLEFSKKAGNNEERTRSFELQVEILEKLLPNMMTENEISDFIKPILVENGFSTKKDMGKVMKIIVPQLEGKADKSVVSKVVLSLLS